MCKNLWFKNLLAEVCHFNSKSIGTCFAKQNQAGSYMGVTVEL